MKKGTNKVETGTINLFFNRFLYSVCWGVRAIEVECAEKTRERPGLLFLKLEDRLDPFII